MFLEPKTPLTPPTEIIDDVLKAAQDDRRHETSKPSTVEITPGELKEKKDKLIQKENIETGSVSFILALLFSSLQSKLFQVKLNVFLTYIRACTVPMVSAVFFMFTLTALSALGTNIWLSKWTDRSKNDTLSTNQTVSSKNQVHNLIIYSTLGFCQGKNINIH